MSKGFDNLPINHHLDLALPFTEYAGVGGDYTLDISKNHFPFELHGPPTWAVPGPPTSIRCLNFAPGNPDWLDCPGATTAALDYTSEDFSGAVWVNPTDLSANRSVICRGLLDTDGWYVQVLINGNIFFITNQAAASQWTTSVDATVVINTWTLIGWSRDGATCRLYRNGVETVYDTVGVHIDPLTSNRETHVGIYDNETGSPWSCYMWYLRSWGDRILSADDHAYIYATERHWLGL